VVERARSRGLTSDEHFTVDGTLLEAWAGAKSFQRKNGRTPLHVLSFATRHGQRPECPDFEASYSYPRQRRRRGASPSLAVQKRAYGKPHTALAGLPTQLGNDKGRYHSLKSTARERSCGSR
jgi:hypothetical protein